MTGIPFGRGEFVEFREPNAAGYGDPLLRDPALVREDVLDDFTTVELARDAYGVVFADERTLDELEGEGRVVFRTAPGSKLLELTINSQVAFEADAWDDERLPPHLRMTFRVERAVRRDAHKMTAFVRFGAVTDPLGERFVAWFEPRPSATITMESSKPDRL